MATLNGENSDTPCFRALTHPPAHPLSGGNSLHFQGCIKLWFGPRAVPARSSHEGKKAPEGPAPKHIVMRYKPGRLAVRELNAAMLHFEGSQPLFDGGNLIWEHPP